MLLLVLVQMQVFLVPADNHCSLGILTLSVQLICIKWKKACANKKVPEHSALKRDLFRDYLFAFFGRKRITKED